MDTTRSEEHLHQELSLVDAAAFSVGLIGPVGAIALLGTGAALIIGPAVTLSFVFAGGALLCYTIYRNVFVGQIGTFARLPYIEVAYLIAGIVVMSVAPGLVGRVRAGLAAGSTP